MATTKDGIKLPMRGGAQCNGFVMEPKIVIDRVLHVGAGLRCSLCGAVRDVASLTFSHTQVIHMVITKLVEAIVVAKSMHISKKNRRSRTS